MKVEALADDTVVFRDGEWLLIDPRPTIGNNWRVFDGWWKPADDSDTREVDQVFALDRRSPLTSGAP